jgi:protein phosphatase
MAIFYIYAREFMALIDALQIVSLTDIGRVRSQNEDSVATLPEIGLVLLADGMGGHNAGEVASGMAAALIPAGIAADWHPAAHETLAADAASARAQILLETQVSAANAAINAKAQDDPECEGMGTTVVVALFHSNLLTVAHVGDSRLYRLRDALLERLTRDHSVLQEQIDAGLISATDALLSNNRNWLTRAVGVEPDVAVEIHTHIVREADIFLLCSDGLYDMLDESDIALTLSALQVNLTLCAQRLVQAANDAGGRDNISVILIRVAGIQM